MAAHSLQTIYLRIRDKARALRNHQTPAETFFWERVRDRRLLGLKFNRQFILQCPIDPTQTKFYIADFHCHELKLIVELDGEYHLDIVEFDLARSEQLELIGYTVLRFSNAQVLNNWDHVEMTIGGLLHG